MLHRKNKNLRLVKDGQPISDNQMEKIMAELEDEDMMAEEFKHQKNGHRRNIFLGIIVVLAVVSTVFLFVYLQTFTTVRVLDTYKIRGATESNYKEFARGVLKYSRDGISYLDKNGEEKWNQPCQIKSPFVDVNEVSVVVADKGGNDIMVFQEDGLKGEIQTTLPIEKVSVSEQGIVSAILKNGSSPSIVCYDTAGNILVEHKATLNGKGYPLDVAISPNGEVMQVVYLYIREGKLVSKVGYYNFGKSGGEKTDHEVTNREYKDSIVASGFFLNQSVSAVVGDNCLTIFKGKEEPEEVTTVTVEKEIQSVFHNEKYIGMILRNEGKSGYEICLYNTSGKKVMAKDFTDGYKNAKISGNQVILYDGKKCSIFLRSGVHRFEGEMSNHILEIIPIAGANKYIVMNANGMEDVRLVK